MDTGQSSSTRTPACSPLSKVPLVDTAFPVTYLGFGLLPRHLPEKDGSDPWRMPRMYQNRRRHHCTWLHTEAEHNAQPMRSHAELPANTTWCSTHRRHTLRPKLSISLDASTMPMVSIQTLEKSMLYMPCQHPPTSLKLQGILRSSHVPKSLHPWSIHLDCPSMRAAQEGHRLQLELYLWHHVWADQGSCCQWHHPQVLWPITICDNPSWCLTGRPWCSTPAEWQTCSLCQQGPHWNWMPICKHRERC